MADLFCKSMDSPCFSAIISKAHLFSRGPMKLETIGMRRKQMLHLTLISKLTPSEVGVVSTHEQSDGSIVFRFGEVEKGKDILPQDEDAASKVLYGDRDDERYVNGDSSPENFDTVVDDSSKVENFIVLVGTEEEIEANQSPVASMDALEITGDQKVEAETIKGAEKCTDDHMVSPISSEKPAESSFEAARDPEFQNEMQPLVEIPSSLKEVSEDPALNSNGTEVEAAVSTEKRQVASREEFFLSSGAALLPHPSKELTGGEDAYFIAGETWLGVADGVVLWSFEGTKPGVFAQELIKNCERLISHSNANPVDNPLELLLRSVAETQSPGSSTCLVSRFDGQALHTANVGDSRFIVLRHGSVHKKSSSMHHHFHFPLHIQSGDDPSPVAETYRTDLIEDDVIITATDGFFDNLYDQEISSIVSDSLLADKSLEEIAMLLAMKAQEIGRSANLRTPFSDEAQAAGFAGCTGGRLDDVAVIVSRVGRR